MTKLLLCLVLLSIASSASAQPSILTPPVDATVCLNSVAEFYCSTDGEYIEYRLNGTGVDALQIITNYLNPGIEATLLVPGIHKFENTDITCIGGTFGVGSSTSDPAQLFVQGPPSPPSDLAATPLNETSIKLTWSVPPGVLDEELISYLVEVRNESGGLIVHSETDGTEYTFSMDNPDPCDLYSFTVTPLCGTVEGGTSAKVNGTLSKVAGEVGDMSFSMTLMDSEMAVMKLSFSLSDGVTVCSYSVNSTSTDGEPLFTNKQFPPLAGEDNTVSISLPLPTSEEYYITVSACNALECGPPSSPVFISTLNVQNVNITSEGNTVIIRCDFIEDATAIGCFTIFTRGSATMPLYSGAERQNSTAVGHVALPHGSYNWSVFGVESTGLPEHSAAATGTVLVEGYEEIHVNQPPSVDISITFSSKEDKVCVKLGSGPKKVVLFHSLHDHVNELWSDFLNDDDDDDDERDNEKACFNETSSEDVVAVFEGSVLSGETPYIETVMDDVPPSSTNPVHSPTTTTTTPEVSKDKSTVASICGVLALVLILCVVVAIVAMVVCRRRKKTKKQDIKNGLIETKKNVAYSSLKPLQENEPFPNAVTKNPLQEENGGHMPSPPPLPLPSPPSPHGSPPSPHGSPPSPHGSPPSLVSGTDGASPNGGHVTSPTPAPSPHHHSDGVDGKLEKEDQTHDSNGKSDERDQPQANDKEGSGESPQECGDECQQQSIIHDGDSEPKSLQGQCVHGSSSPIVSLPADAQHVYSSEGLTEPKSDQPHQECDEDTTAEHNDQDTVVKELAKIGRPRSRPSSATNRSLEKGSCGAETEGTKIEEKLLVNKFDPLNPPTPYPHKLESDIGGDGGGDNEDDDGIGEINGRDEERNSLLHNKKKPASLSLSKPLYNFLSLPRPDKAHKPGFLPSQAHRPNLQRSLSSDPSQHSSPASPPSSPSSLALINEVHKPQGVQRSLSSPAQGPNLQRSLSSDPSQHSSPASPPSPLALKKQGT